MGLPAGSSKELGLAYGDSMVAREKTPLSEFLRSGGLARGVLRLPDEAAAPVADDHGGGPRLRPALPRARGRGRAAASPPDAGRRPRRPRSAAGRPRRRGGDRPADERGRAGVRRRSQRAATSTTTDTISITANPRPGRAPVFHLFSR